MAKLNQIIAIEKGVKSRVYSQLTDFNKAVQKAELFNGFSKDYEKQNEEFEDLPPERKKVRFRAEDVVGAVEQVLTELITVTARKDWSNNTATADLTVNGKVLVSGVPVTHLLFLEKQLTDFRTFMTNVPVLDSDEDWEPDAGSGLHRTAPISTHRTKKVQKPVVLYDATKEHPAQTAMVTEDVLAGYWKTVKRSGALPEMRRREILERIEQLLDAVKKAREEANSVDEAVVPDVGHALFDYAVRGVL